MSFWLFCVVLVHRMLFFKGEEEEGKKNPKNARGEALSSGVVALEI